MHFSLKEKLAQMCLIGIRYPEDIEPVKKLIKTYSIGGVIIYKADYDKYREMVNLIKSLKTCNKKNKLPLFIAIEQEPGKINNMPDRFRTICDVSKLGKTHNIEFIKKAGNYIGNILEKTGINMDIAPVLDLNVRNRKSITKNRTFSKNPELVATYGMLFQKELRNRKVISVVKHFPGYGAINRNAQAFPPCIKNYEKIRDKHLYPFYQAIQEDVDAILVGHIRVKRHTGFYPASLSKTFIQSELRGNLGYKNVIMTDELGKSSIPFLYGKKRSIRLAFQAGNDIIRYNYYPDIENDLIINTMNLVNNEVLSKKAIDESFQRILSLKKKYGLNDSINYVGVNVNLINYKINELNRTVDNYLDGK